MQELKPCPFCGCAPELYGIDKEYKITSYFACIQCLNDKCKAQFLVLDETGSNIENILITIEKWNRRVGE